MAASPLILAAMAAPSSAETIDYASLCAARKADSASVLAEAQAFREGGSGPTREADEALWNALAALPTFAPLVREVRTAGVRIEHHPEIGKSTLVAAYFRDTKAILLGPTIGFYTLAYLAHEATHAHRDVAGRSMMGDDRRLVAMTDAEWLASAYDEEIAAIAAEFLVADALDRRGDGALLAGMNQNSDYVPFARGWRAGHARSGSSDAAALDALKEAFLAHPLKERYQRNYGEGRALMLSCAAAQG